MTGDRRNLHVINFLTKYGLDASLVLEDGFNEHGYYTLFKNPSTGKAIFAAGEIAKEFHNWPSPEVGREAIAAWKLDGYGYPEPNGENK